MSSETRKKVRRGVERGLSVRVGKREDIPAFARLLQEMGKRKQVLVRDEQSFAELFEAYPESRRQFQIAEADGKIVGGQFGVTLGRTAWALHVATEYESRRLYPNETLASSMIDHIQQAGCTLLDLEGTCTNWPPSESDKGFGVYSFKKHLGARAVLLAPYCDLVFNRLLYSLAALAEDGLLPLLLEHGAGRFGGAFRRVRSRFSGTCEI